MTMKKASGEHMEKLAERPIVEGKSEEIEKVQGPQHAAFSKDEIHAASLLHAPPGDGSAPERARRMAALQQYIGNARLTRLLGEIALAFG
jgi:hypothetical protein